MSNMQHPIYPLQLEERRELEKHLLSLIGGKSSTETANDIRKRYRERRDVEFPDWANVYSAEVESWVKQQKAIS